MERLEQRKNTRREYTVHFNLQKDAQARDILESYYLGRLIDHNIQVAKKKSEDQKLTAHLIIQSVRKAEWEF